MTTLHDLVRMDKAIAGVDIKDCHFIASVLLFVSALEKKWYLNWLVPKKIKERAFQMRMLAAVLGRTAEEREPSIHTQIKLAIQEDRKPR